MPKFGFMSPFENDEEDTREINYADEGDLSDQPYMSVSDRVKSQPRGLPDVSNQNVPINIPGITDLPAAREVASSVPSVKDYIRNKMSPDFLMNQYQRDKQGLQDFEKTKLQADYASNLGQAFQSLARGVAAPQATSLYDNIEKQGKDLLGAKEKELGLSNQVMNAIANRQARDDMRGLAQQRFDLARRDRMSREDEKRQEKEDQLAVPGFERTGEVLPKAEEAAKLRGAVASANELTSKLGRLKDLVNQYGSFEYGGEGGQEMESLATEIQLLAKNQDMYNLGVLTGPDLNLLQKLTADPASLTSLLTRDKTRLKQIDTQLQSIAGKLNTKAQSLGYRKAGAPQSASLGVGGGQEKASSGKIVLSNGRETFALDPNSPTFEEDLQDAQTEGFRRM